MKLRRYYRRGIKYPYTVSKAYLNKISEEKGALEAHRIDNAEYEIVLSEGEQKSWFFDCLRRVMSNPRFYLDNLEFLSEFRVNYSVVYK